LLHVSNQCCGKFLFCPFTVPFPNTTLMFFTILKTSFPLYYFGALSFSTVL
jgi:hypothetical protein